MKKNVLFIYRGQVLLKEFLPEYKKYSEDNCLLLVEKGIPFNVVSMDIKKMGLNVNLMTHDDLLENKIKMKFNVIVMNPPYKGGLHIDFFNNAFELLEDEGMITSIQPATPFLNTNTPKPNKKDVLIRQIVQNHKSLIKMVDGNELFNEGFFVPLSIITLTKSIDNDQNVCIQYQHSIDSIQGVHKYKTFNDVFIHGNNLVLNIRDKIFNKKILSLNDKSSKKITTSPFWVSIAAVVGHPPKNNKVNPDFYCLVFKRNENDFNPLIIENYNDLPGRANGRDKRGIAVNSRDEAINLIKTMMTKTFRFALSLSKIGSNLWGGNMLDTVPYLDFSNEWTDEMLFDYFEFTEEEINFINNYVGNWYERDFI
jgi:hypothetical protein